LAHTKLKLEQLTNELRHGRESNGFVETDLSEWEELINLPNVVVRKNRTALVCKIRVNIIDTSEVFERTSGNAAFEEEGKVAYVTDGPDIYTEVRGKVEYMTGKHTLCFKAEKLNGWTVFRN
jgi:hypothetical protein